MFILPMPNIVVAGRWESSWFSTRIEVRLWRHSIRPFSVDQLAMVPKTNITCGSVLDLREFNSMEELIAAYPDYKKVFIEAPSDWDSRGLKYTPLRKYKHPKGDVLYIFGSTGTDNIPLSTNSDDRVGIETPSKESMWSFVAAAVVLSHRLMR